ncbi:hypothetical protein NAT65_27390, partial [Achromobacter xylosoxidans]|nr:hypothetical protein [Achromobacter xylosoxidans]
TGLFYGGQLKFFIRDRAKEDRPAERLGGEGGSDSRGAPRSQGGTGSTGQGGMPGSGASAGSGGTTDTR